MSSSKAARNLVRNMGQDEFVLLLCGLRDSNLSHRYVTTLTSLLLGIRNGFGDQ